MLIIILVEIHQQILDDQSAQSVTNNNDNGTDSGIQRSRSSITRTLLMNAGKRKFSLIIILLFFIIYLKNEIMLIHPPQIQKDDRHHQNFQKILNI